MATDEAPGRSGAGGAVSVAKRLDKDMAVMPTMIFSAAASQTVLDKPIMGRSTKPASVQPANAPKLLSP